MTNKSQGPKGRDGVLSSLNVAIGALDRARKATNMTSAKATFTSAGVLLTMIIDSVVNKVEYVELGLTCADVCEALSRGMDKKRSDQLSQSILEAVERLTMTMDEIQRHIIRRGKRNVISRLYHAKDDKKAITAWRLDLNGILHVFNTELRISPHATVSDANQDAANKHTVVSDARRDGSNAEVIVPDVRRDVSNAHPIVSDVQSDVANSRTVVSDIHYNKLKSREGTDGRNEATHASAPEKSPPPLQRNTRRPVFDTRRSSQTIFEMYHKSKRREGSDGQHSSTQNSVLGELPPPPPGVFFGRDELIEEIVCFAQCLTSIALIGAGGIGKTSVVLTVLHDDRIKQRFGDNRRFIPCDKFPASRAYFLRQLSKIIGAGIENPEDLAPLRRHLSSKDMIIVLDNAESILDLQGSGAQEIYTVVDELTRFNNICLCITSRVSTIPPHCETLRIPTLSMEAACDTFYRIYKHGERSNPINDILKQLEFHPLSITLLATAAQHNTWDTNRLTREWESKRTGVLHTRHSRSLATMIELSLASPMFQELGSNARELLGVVAFFPQGIGEENTEWLFPTISNGPNMLDRFCTLSLAYRTNGFITMLAPLRDYLCPKDSMPPPLLVTTKEHYLSRLSARVHPDEPGFEESRWITSEDVNIEHLLDVFTLTDPSSKNVWDACANFMAHLYWHKPRLVTLGLKIEALPDDHPSKPQCLRYLSWLFYSVGSWVECKRLLTHTLQLCRERKDDKQVAEMLCYLSNTNRRMGLPKDGIQQAKEALEIFQKLGEMVKEVESLIFLAYALCDDKQLDAAEEAASCAINLLPEKGQPFLVSQGHHVLGDIYHSKGNHTKEAIHHLEEALKIATPLNIPHQLFWVHHTLTELFLSRGSFDDAQAHIERAKLYKSNDAYHLGHMMELQANVWYKQRMFKKAKSEASQAAEVFEKLGAARDLGRCRELLQREEMNKPVVSDESDADASTYVEGSLSTSPTILSPR